MGASWEEEEEAKTMGRARSFSTGQLLLQAVGLAGGGERPGPVMPIERGRGATLLGFSRGCRQRPRQRRP